MDINYFLLCKKKYTNIIYNFENIINECDDIINEIVDFLQNKHTIQDDESFKTRLSQTFNLKKHYIQEKEKMNYLFKECNENIQKMCNHEFINDVIDITPEFSKNICYCILCEYTI